MLGSEQVIANELLAKVPTEFNTEQLGGGSISLKKLTRQAARDVERRVILKALEMSGWNRKVAALSLNSSYRTLLYKFKHRGLTPSTAPTSPLPPTPSTPA